jgi:hypothetical protein
MPSTREEHVRYTRNELNNYPYYVEVIKELKKYNIKSYLDIGANTGEFCNVLFEKLLTLKKAYLIEPEIENFLFLKNNVTLKNVNFFNIAIGYNISSPKIISLYNNVGGFQVINSSDNGIPVVVKTLEELKIPKVDLVKIDIEGGEYNLIENSSYLQNVKWLDIEFHDYHNIPTREYVEKYFPNHVIEVIESLEGRCLLKKIK